MTNNWTPEAARERLAQEYLTADQDSNSDWSRYCAALLDLQAYDTVLAARDTEVARLRAALAFYADPANYVLTGAPNATAELHTWAPHVMGDDGERARAAL